MNIKSVSLNTIKLEGIFVLQDDFDTGDMELQFSNADFLNALRSEHLIEFYEWSDAATLACISKEQKKIGEKSMLRKTI